MEIKKNTSLKQIVEEYNKQQDYIEKLRKEFENYLNKEEIHKIIKTSLTNNIRLENYYEDFFIFLKPEQFGQFSGGPDGYSITIGYKGNNEGAHRKFIGFIKIIESLRLFSINSILFPFPPILAVLFLIKNGTSLPIFIASSSNSFSL